MPDYRFGHRRLFVVFAIAAFWCVSAAALEVGMGTADVTPKLEDGKPIYLAGLDSNHAATGVHDKLYARAVVSAQRESQDHDRSRSIRSVSPIP